MNAADDIGFFDTDSLREAMRQLWEVSGRSSGRVWTATDVASAECEAPEPVHPRFDDGDQAASYAYRSEVSSA